MQQAVGGKCSIVILDDLVPVGEEIYMRQEQFRRVGIHCEVQFINGRLLRRTDLRREDVIPDKVKLLCLRERVSIDSSGFSPFST